MTESISLEQIVSDLNNLEIIWYGKNGIKIPVKILADIDIGLSMKHTISNEEVLKRIHRFWGFDDIDLEEISQPEFCFFSIKEPLDLSYELKSIHKFIMETKTFNSDTIGLNTGDNPECPFY